MPQRLIVVGGGNKDFVHHHLITKLKSNNTHTDVVVCGSNNNNLEEEEAMLLYGEWPFKEMIFRCNEHSLKQIRADYRKLLALSYLAITCPPLKHAGRLRDLRPRDGRQHWKLRQKRFNRRDRALPVRRVIPEKGMEG